jgi:hypothetical protein
MPTTFMPKKKKKGSKNKRIKSASSNDIINGDAPQYRRPQLVMDGKHSPTIVVIPSHTPPTQADVKFKSAHNRQGFPTG